MAKTKAELSTDTLLGIGVLNASETTPAADAAYVERRYDVKLEEWRDMGLVYWPNTDRDTSEIPDVVFSVLCDLMGNEISAAFGSSSKPEDKDARETLLLKRLRRIMAKKSSGEPTRATYY